MTPAELRKAIADRGLNQRQAAAAIRVTEGAVSLWLSGKRPIPGPIEVALQAIPLQAAPKVRPTVRSKRSRKPAA